ncbi:MAG: hypothetical protein JWP89_4761 [Schlesneria sp.]|nr:hypothetical protein [Schlesneria sp.]
MTDEAVGIRRKLPDEASSRLNECSVRLQQIWRAKLEFSFGNAVGAGLDEIDMRNRNNSYGRPRWIED